MYAHWLGFISHKAHIAISVHLHVMLLHVDASRDVDCTADMHSWDQKV